MPGCKIILAHRMVILLLALATLTLGQDLCFNLKSSVCGPRFDGFPVALNEHYSNQLEFDWHLSNITTEKHVFATLKKYGCASENMESQLKSLRYLHSFWCARLALHAIESKRCKILPTQTHKKPALCGDKCNAVLGWFEAQFKNPKVCEQNKQLKETRAEMNEVLEKTCKTVQIYKAENCYVSKNDFDSCGKISKILSIRVKLAGFYSIEAARKECPKLTEDKCCREKYNNSFLQASSKQVTGIHPGILAAAIGGPILLILALGIFAIFRKRRNTNRRYPKRHVKFADTPSYSRKQAPPVSSAIMQPLPTYASSSAYSGAYASSLTSSKRAGSPVTPQKLMSTRNSISKSGPTPFVASIVPITTPSNASSSSSDVQRTPTPPKRKSQLVCVMKVIHPYTPNLEDELELDMNDHILVVKDFDDGWGLGVNKASGKQGVFPLVCTIKLKDEDIRKIQTDINDITPSKRSSSMMLSGDDIDKLRKAQDGGDESRLETIEEDKSEVIEIV